MVIEEFATAGKIMISVKIDFSGRKQRTKHFCRFRCNFLKVCSAGRGESLSPRLSGEVRVPVRGCQKEKISSKINAKVSQKVWKFFKKRRNPSKTRQKYDKKEKKTFKNKAEILQNQSKSTTKKSRNPPISGKSQSK